MLVECPGFRGGNVDSLGDGPAHAAVAVEVVDGCEGVVDGGRSLPHDGEQVGAPLTDGPIPGAGVGEEGTVTIDGVQPGEVLANLGGVGAAGLGRQRRPGQFGPVGRVDRLKPRRQDDG
jgi:hypothetical protein